MEGAVRRSAPCPASEPVSVAANLPAGLAPIATQVKSVSAKRGMNIEGHG